MTFATDSSHFSLTGAYYPKGHIFAMFANAAAAQAAADQVQSLPGVGAVQTVSPQAVEQAFAKRAAEVGGVPSVGREDQFMLRYVELARQGSSGVLIEKADADTDAVRHALTSGHAQAAYYYQTLVIEELVEASPRAEAAAAGKL